MILPGASVVQMAWVVDELEAAAERCRGQCESARS